MIVYDLKCEHDHVFEVWFASSQAYEDQRARGLVACAFCGSTEVGKAVMAPRLNAKGNQRDASLPAVIDAPSTPSLVSISNAPASAPAPAEIAKLQAVLHALAQAQAKALEQSTWVGRDFADRARAMHYGEEDHAPIHGQADPDEAAALVEEGVAVAPLPFPVIPPDAKN
ncbi:MULTISPECIES: DUF1178 family protein [Pseudomonadota]|jgi:hypothetical protein|uniref:DUF1178 family protein n=1 Tax=Pseudomonadota TaxID=1224 RepID=UPI00076A3846|nr:MULTISPECIES: DUF1178 family protein [Pseudomonadota]MAF62800.1 DUF1178 domain-containing protein [Blastomonas sp.]|tara:strand:+ start:53794 stop:54303 length:510 start_codon:yes stop_codon:yes gene_type:complete